MTSSSHIVIIGAGIIGLTAAIQVQDLVISKSLPLKILLVARDFPTTLGPDTVSPNYASMHAGAHVRPIPASTPQLAREAGWLKRACEVFSTQAVNEPWLGVIQVPGVEYFEDPPQEYVNLDATTFQQESGLTGFRKFTELELPRGVRLGYEYDTYCIYSSVYCMALLRKFILRGGQVKQQELQCEDEAFTIAEEVRVVVNASGMGFGDKKCFPIRGQVVLTNIPAKKTVTRQNADGSWRFVIPRAFSEGTIVGGTKEPHNWDSTVSSSTTDALIVSVGELGQISSSPANKLLKLEDVAVVKEIVGRRPARKGGMRVEIEKRSSNHVGGRTETIVHAYGAGGRGYEISWGVAEEVRGLVEQVLREEQGVRARL